MAEQLQDALNARGCHCCTTSSLQLSKDAALLQGRCSRCLNVRMEPGRALPALGMWDGDAPWHWVCSVPQTKQLLSPEGPGAKRSRWAKPAAPSAIPSEPRLGPCAAPACSELGNTSFVSKWVRRRRDVTIAMGMRFHNFILRGVCCRIRQETEGGLSLHHPRSLPSPARSCRSPPAPCPHTQSRVCPSGPLGSPKAPVASPYLSQLAGLRV